MYGNTRRTVRRFGFDEGTLTETSDGEVSAQWILDRHTKHRLAGVQVLGEHPRASCSKTVNVLSTVGTEAGVSRARVQQIEQSDNIEIATLVRVAAACGYQVGSRLEHTSASAGGVDPAMGGGF